MKKITLYITVFAFYSLQSCVGQKNDNASTDTKQVITKYDTLFISAGKKYPDYYDSCMSAFSLYWKYVEDGAIDKALAVNDSLIVFYRVIENVFSTFA